MDIAIFISGIFIGFMEDENGQWRVSLGIQNIPARAFSLFISETDIHSARGNDLIKLRCFLFCDTRHGTLSHGIIVMRRP
jgi:hypothetical protein